MFFFSFFNFVLLKEYLLIDFIHFWYYIFRDSPMFLISLSKSEQNLTFKKALKNNICKKIGLITINHMIRKANM